MDAKTCLQKLLLVGVLSFSTVGLDSSPQVHKISAIHYEPDALCFFLPPGARRSAANCCGAILRR